MSAKSATGSSGPSVQKLIIEKDVEKQIRSWTLWRRLRDEGLPHGSIELYLKCPSLNLKEWSGNSPFGECHSLLRIDLSGCPKLESIPEIAFGTCRHLVSVVFGERSNITNLGAGAFQRCSALTSITLPEMLKIIERLTFGECSPLERFDKNVTFIGKGAF